jgi:hypothetical protein
MATRHREVIKYAMTELEYLRRHIDRLISLSHDVKDRAASAKLREMADECRIFLSLADIGDVAAGLSRNAAVAKQRRG